jgi:polyhydroxyalkanoate synthesis regulator phasin
MRVGEKIREIFLALVDSTQEGADAALRELRYRLTPVEEEVEEEGSWEKDLRELLEALEVRVSSETHEIKRRLEELENDVGGLKHNSSMVSSAAGEIWKLRTFYRDNLQKIVNMIFELERRVADATNQEYGAVKPLHLPGHDDDPGGEFRRVALGELGLRGGSLQEAAAAACDVQEDGAAGTDPGNQDGKSVAVQFVRGTDETG